MSGAAGSWPSGELLACAVGEDILIYRAGTEKLECTRDERALEWLKSEATKILTHTSLSAGLLALSSGA